MMPAKSRQKDQDSVALVRPDRLEKQVSGFIISVNKLKKKSNFIFIGLANSPSSFLEALLLCFSGERKKV